MDEALHISGSFGSFITGFTHKERLNMPELSFKAYIQLVEPLAKEIEEQTGIIHILPLIQSAHESRAGNSNLAKEYGNLFGFKVTESWRKNGKPIANLPTWEVVTTNDPDKYKDYTPSLIEKYTEQGKKFFKLKIVLKQEFRIYDTWRDSLFDWGRLISTVKVYSEAYKKLKNKDTIRDGIREMAAVYATDPNYALALITLYEKVETEAF